MEKVTLNNGISMPLEGFGVFQITDPRECEEVTWGALKAGYRMIDTAAAYGNEEAVGRAIRKSGIPREEIFIVSKLWLQDYGYENAQKGLKFSLEKLDQEYIDLYLLHQPLGDTLGAWRALEDAYQEGRVRAIGVANFSPAQLTDFCESVTLRPAVDQVEIHPFFAQKIAAFFPIRCWQKLGDGTANRRLRWLCAGMYSGGFPSSRKPPIAGI